MCTYKWNNFQNTVKYITEYAVKMYYQMLSKQIINISLLFFTKFDWSLIISAFSAEWVFKLEKIKVLSSDKKIGKKSRNRFLLFFTFHHPKNRFPLPGNLRLWHWRPWRRRRTCWDTRSTSCLTPLRRASPSARRTELQPTGRVWSQPRQHIWPENGKIKFCYYLQ